MRVASLLFFDPVQLMSSLKADFGRRKSGFAISNFSPHDGTFRSFLFFLSRKKWFSSPKLISWEIFLGQSSYGCSYTIWSFSKLLSHQNWLISWKKSMKVSKISKKNWRLRLFAINFEPFSNWSLQICTQKITEFRVQSLLNGFEQSHFKTIEKVHKLQQKLKMLNLLDSFGFILNCFLK